MGWLPGSGCVLWLQMGERQGSIVYDLSDKGNHGTIYGATWQRGKIGYCLSFDGVDDYVDIPDVILGIRNNFTIEFYTAPRTVTVQGRMIQLYGEMFFCVDINASAAGMLDSHVRIGGVWSTVSYPFTLQEGWIHLAIVKSATAGLLLHKNGGLVASNAALTADIDSYTFRSYLGQYLDGSIMYNGLLDEVRIYNRVLSPGEIDAHYWYGMTRALRPPQ